MGQGSRIEVMFGLLMSTQTTAMSDRTIRLQVIEVKGGDQLPSLLVWLRTRVISPLLPF